MAVLELVDVHKRYGRGELAVAAVRGATFTVAAGEFAALVGPSGCGKSTLLHLCGAMDRPTRGTVRLAGALLESLDDDELTRLRRSHVGFVFQFFNLLPTLTVAQNVALPLLLAGAPASAATERAEHLAARVGLGARTGHLPAQLSGGEAQRAAIARAVIHRPRLLIADEPTGNLDSVNGSRALELLLELNARLGTAVLLATHDDRVAARAGRIIEMQDGAIVRDAAADRAAPPAPDRAVAAQGSGG